MTIHEALELARQHQQAGRLAEAEAICGQILRAAPRCADGLYLAGFLSRKRGQHLAEIDFLKRAIAIQPFVPRYHNSLALALRDIGRPNEALASCADALRLDPRSADASYLRGLILQDARQTDEAIAAYRAAVRFDQGHALAHNNLGILLKARGIYDAAIAEYRAAIQNQPGLVEAHNNLGNVLLESGDVDGAILAFKTALRLKPDLAMAANHLGNAWKEAGLLDLAVESYRRAVVSSPGVPAYYSNIIYTLQFHPDYHPEAIAGECAVWVARYGKSPPVARHENTPAPDRRIRIGYVSPDFYFQAECFFVIPLLEAHDRTKFEVYAYASVRRPDFITERIQKSVDVWRDVGPLSDQAVAEQIRKDGIDILVDLTMHMAWNRLPAFAAKPAPVQVAWLAYPGSTGLRAIDYRLTDSHMEPEGGACTWSAEKPIRLPDSWCCYSTVTGSPEVNPLPALANRGVTFGSLNNFCKVNDRVLVLWARVLKAAPGSRFLMLCPEGKARKRIVDSFASHGIERERIEFVAKLSREDYLRAYHRIDIGLDTFPYNGITTTCDALWMGVPVLALQGNAPASRAGFSLLTSAGMPEFAARNEAEYVTLAKELAADLHRLARVRSGLRERLQTSSLMDAPRFARNFEAACRELWAAWCGEEKG